MIIIIVTEFLSIFLQKQIKANEMDFWKSDYQELHLMQEQKMYPPARPYIVHSETSHNSVVISFEFNGTKRENFAINIHRELIRGKFYS